MTSLTVGLLIQENILIDRKTNSENSARAMIFFLALLFSLVSGMAQTLPRVVALDPAKLNQTKTRIANKDVAFTAALAKLRRDAEKVMTGEPFTIMSKERVPPSGDKHDYLTLAPYWWPDPKKADGLPYIRRDGEVNPESKRDTDNATLNAMANAVETLSLAYYFTGEEKYAGRAALLLRTWFIAKETKMNPNYEYAQAVMGRNSGRGAGLIDARKFIQVVDAVGLLSDSKAWTKQDQQGLQDWYRAFVKWLQTSANGKDEASARNNHGSWFAAALAAFSLFIGDESLTRQTVEAVKARIVWQIEPDGQQPLELDRTRGMSYSLFNLNALLTVASIGEKVGVDLWSYQTKDGRSIRKALENLAPFALGEKEWAHQQIIKWSPEEYFTMVRKVASKFQDENFKALMAKVPAVNSTERSVLLNGEGSKNEVKK